MRALFLLIPLILVGGYFWYSTQTANQTDGQSALGGSETSQGLEGEPGELPDGGTPELVPALRGPVAEQRPEAPVRQETDLRYPLEIHLVMVQPGPEEAGEGSEFRAGAKAAIRGHLHTDGGTPLAGRVLFIAGANQGRELSCSSDGTFQASDLYPGLSIVRVLSGRGQFSEREVRLGQFGNTELNVSFGPRSGARVRGRVQDGFGKPVAQATVRVDGQEAQTDSEGRFEIYRTTSGKILVMIAAEGYASYREQISVMRGKEVGPDRLMFQLEKEAILDLEVLGLSNGTGPGEIYLFPAGGQRINSKRGQRTFPWHTVNPIELKPGLTTTVRGLPAGVVTVMGFHPGMVASPVRRNVKLNGGQRASGRVEFSPGPSIKGQVLLDDKPKGKVRIRLEALDANQASMRALGRRPSFGMEMVVDILPPADQRTVTDAAGRFLLATQPDMQSEYMLWATSEDGQYRTIQRVSGETLNGDLRVNLLPIEAGKGELTLDFPGVGSHVPYRLWIDNEPGEIQVLPLGDSLLVEGLTPGLWRMDVSRFQNYAERGLRLWVPPGERIEHQVALSEELWSDKR